MKSHGNVQFLEFWGHRFHPSGGFVGCGAHGEERWGQVHQGLTGGFIVMGLPWATQIAGVVENPKRFLCDLPYSGIFHLELYSDYRWLIVIN